MKLHILNNHSSIEEKKKGFKYYCETCNYGVINEKKYNQVNHFQEMFNIIARNYKKISFQNFHRKKIKDQLNLLLNYK